MMGARFLTRMGSKFKLYLAFVVLGAITLCIFSYAIWAAKVFSTDVSVVSREVFPKTKLALEAEGVAGQVIEKFNVARAAGSDQELESIAPLHEKILGVLDELLKLCVPGSPREAAVAEIIAMYGASHDAALKMVAASIDQDYEQEAEWTRVFDEQNVKFLEALNEIVNDSSMVHSNAMQNVTEVSHQLTNMLLGSFVFLALFGSFTFFLIYRMSQKLQAMSEQTTDVASSVLRSMSYISDMATQLSDEVSSSAASLQEISAASETMASKARQNVQEARDADSCSKRVFDKSTASKDSIGNVVRVMEAMDDAGREISSLVKVIEDIAFQTNLLALNAAVEAARAGEAGMGFGVVAEEVRNLAGRSQEASKQVAAIVGSMDAKIKTGNQVVGELEASFPEVVKEAKTMGEQMENIIGNSTRQSEGQGEISKTVSMIDSSVQALAAMSEESSATVQEVEGQVENLRGLVEELMVFWEGKRTVAAQNSRAVALPPK